MKTLEIIAVVIVTPLALAMIYLAYEMLFDEIRRRWRGW